MKSLLILLLSLSTLAHASEQDNKETKLSIPINYASNVDSPSFHTKLKEIENFSNVEYDHNGSPLLLITTLHNTMTNGGQATGLFSAMLAGGSLGLIPMVTNQDLTITYNVMVNRQVLARFSYTENFTDAVSLYNAGNLEIDEDVEAWLLSTLPKFEEELKQHSDFSILLYEYDLYFNQ
ncbi:hypothetical protein [Kangiella sp. M94]